MRESARALITNREGSALLVLQNYIKHPEWFCDKWYTVGGYRDAGDESIEATLARELQEELGSAIVRRLEIRGRVDQVTFDGRLHHFFHVEYEGGTFQVPESEELLEGRFFSLDEIERLRRRDRLIMGCEPDILRKILGAPGM